MSPLVLELEEGLLRLEDPLARRLDDVRASIFETLGVALPVIELRFRNARGQAPKAAENHATVLIHGVPAARFVLEAPTPHRTSDEVERLAHDVESLLRSRAADFVGLHEAQKLLDTVEQFLPATVRNVVPKPVSLQTFADVLRRLLEEGISIRDMRSILEALSTIGPHEKDALQLAEYVRSTQKRMITHKLSREGNSVEVVTLDGMIEDSIRRAVTRTAAGSFLSLPPAVGRDLLASISRAVQGVGNAGTSPTILTQPDIRRFVRKLIETDLPNVNVISFAELLPEVAIRETGRANLEGIG